MAKRRTKKQKQKISKKRRSRKARPSSSTELQGHKTQAKQSNSKEEKNSYKLPSSRFSKKSQQKTAKSLLRVNPRYLKEDLLRSLIITCILVIALIGIYFYMRYN